MHLTILEALRKVNEGLDFTKDNLKKFLSKLDDYIKTENIDVNNLDAIIELVTDWTDKLKNELDLKTYCTDPEELLLNYIEDPSSIENVTYVYSTENTQSKADDSYFKLYFAKTLDLSEFKASRVLDKLHNCLDNLLKIKNKEDVDSFLTLIFKGGSYALGSGQISGAVKYQANAIKLKIKEGYFPIELRINSGASDKSKKRVYGVISNEDPETKTRDIYLVKAYTKNSGQNAADLDFDNFIKIFNDLKDLSNNSVKYSI